MGFWDSLRSMVTPWRWLSPQVTYLGAGDVAGMLDPSRLTAAQMWRDQPQLRTVVDFRARNIAQLGLHVYRREADGGRQRDHDSPLAQALREPDLFMDSHQLIYALAGDIDLYDRAYWVITSDGDTGAPRLRRLPPNWVSPVWKNPWKLTRYDVSLGDQVVQMRPDQILWFRAYAPESVYGCSPTVEVLKETLKEQREATESRRKMRRNRARISAYIHRPADAPEWSKEARKKFMQDWYETFTGSGDKVGGTPLLGDGMKLMDPPRNDADSAEAATHHNLSLQTVAAAFHVNPVMVGDNSGASYSNVREFHKMLYSDTLGPTLDRIETAINTFLLPALGMSTRDYYVEFNVKEKLKGSFLEEARVLTAMTGTPFMSVNEARVRQNMTKLGPEFDEVITPLNVLRGGQSSPQDSGSQNESTGENNDLEQRSSGRVPRVKSASPRQFNGEMEDLFTRTFERQRQAVKSRVGAGSEQWWDEDRWDSELADDLQDASTTVVLDAASQVLQEMGVPGTDFNLALTANYLMERSAGQAHDMNAATRSALEKIISSAEDATAVDEYFDGTAHTRAVSAGAATAAALAGFAAVEAGKQAGGSGARKVWRTTSGEPRDSHAYMDGETVGIDELFSNGLRWPGGLGADAAETAGCLCELDIIPGE